MSLQEYVKDKPISQCKMCNLPASIKQEVNDNLKTGGTRRSLVIDYIYEATGVEISDSGYDRHARHALRKASV